VKIVEPTALMREAAAALAPVVNDVVVIGAVAIGVALGRDGTNARKHGATWDVDLVVPIAPTRDIDLAVERDTAPRIVRALKDAGLEPSTDDGERGFTWVSGDLRVQLMTPLGGPRRMSDALRLPVQPALSLCEPTPSGSRVCRLPDDASLLVCHTSGACRSKESRLRPADP
jgi:hypothetical protein